MIIVHYRLGIWVNVNVNEPETMKAHNQAFCPASTRPAEPSAQSK